jgi:hypothetical protein
VFCVAVELRLTGAVRLRTRRVLLPVAEIYREVGDPLA